MKTPTIIAFGEVLWDLFPNGARFGGAPANFACQTANHGAKVSLVSAVGRDRNGEEATAILCSHNVDVSLLQTVDTAPTGTVGVDLDSQGKPTYVIHRDVAWDQLRWHEEIDTRVRESSGVYFGTLGLRSPVSRETILRAVQTATAEGIPRMLDINLRSPFFDDELIRQAIRCASILKLSDEEFGIVCSACAIGSNNHTKALRELLEIGSLDLVVMTKGPEGSVLVTAEEVVEQEGIPTDVIDTVGAGDAFAAVLLIEELRGTSHQESQRKACERASYTCTHAGAVPSSSGSDSRSSHG